MCKCPTANLYLLAYSARQMLLCAAVLHSITPASSWKLEAAVALVCRMLTLLLQIKSVFQTIGACLMAIVNGIGAVLQAIIGAIVSLFDIIISCLTCGRGGGRRRGGTSAV